jgi:hypothetical protein
MANEVSGIHWFHPEFPRYAGGCNCAVKTPTVPTYRDPREHLDDCPAKGSGYAVGQIAERMGADRNESSRLRTLVARAQEIEELPEDTETQEAVKYNRALGLIESLLEAYGVLVGVAPGVGVYEHLRCNDCGAIDNDDTGICHAEDCQSGNLAVEVPRRDDFIPDSVETEQSQPNSVAYWRTRARDAEAARDTYRSRAETAEYTLQAAREGAKPSRPVPPGPPESTAIAVDRPKGFA